MSIAQRLPAELREFLSLPGPQSLLVRGPPGSGKTTLCLALLEASSGQRLLLTSRVSLPELSRGFPWLGENGGLRISIVDTSTIDTSIRDVARAAAASKNLIEGGSAEMRGFSEFFWLPPPIQEAWSQLPADKPSTIIIDSWDALIEQYLGGFHDATGQVPDRAEVERILLRQLSKGRSHVVIVLERREESQLDYLVNGVVVTERELENDRLERWLSLPKLRGIRIANAYYPYTVESARFQCIEPIRPYSEMKHGQFEKEPDSMPGHLWPGSRSFAENFGRLPLGKTTLIETDNEVQDSLVQMLLAPMIASAANQNGRALLIPPPSLSAKDVWESVRGTIPAEKLRHGFRTVDVAGQLVSTAKSTAPEFVEMLLPLRSFLPPHPAKSGSTEPAETEVSRFMTSATTSGAPVFAAAHVRGVTALASALKMPILPEMVDNLSGSIQAALGTTHLHLVVVGRTGTALFEALRPLGTLHIHLNVRQGRVFAYGSKPWTPGFVLAEGSDTTPYDLLRIV